MSRPDPYHFFAAFNPPTATKQERKLAVRGGRAVTYPAEAWERAEADLMAHLERFRPERPMRGAVILDVTWCFPNEGMADGAPHTIKPDTDNLQKGLKDVMTMLGWWVDDAQVFNETVTKVWSRVPGIRIDMEEVVI